MVLKLIKVETNQTKLRAWCIEMKNLFTECLRIIVLIFN